MDSLYAPFSFFSSKSEKRWSFPFTEGHFEFFFFFCFVYFLILTKSHSRTSVPTLKNLLFFLFRKFRSLCHTRSFFFLSVSSVPFALSFFPILSISHFLSVLPLFLFLG